MLKKEKDKNDYGRISVQMKQLIFERAIEYFVT